MFDSLALQNLVDLISDEFFPNFVLLLNYWECAITFRVKKKTEADVSEVEDEEGPLTNSLPIFQLNQVLWKALSDLFDWRFFWISSLNLYACDSGVNFENPQFITNCDLGPDGPPTRLSKTTWHTRTPE